MKKAMTIVLLSLILLSSCELAGPVSPMKTVHLVSVALDYSDTSLNSLEGTVNDQNAIVRQLEYLARKEGCRFDSVNYTQWGSAWTRSTFVWDERIDERVTGTKPIGRHQMKSLVLEELEAISQSAGPDDIMIFYYAGHGADSSEQDSPLNGALVVGDIHFPSIGSWQDEGSNLSSLITIFELRVALSGFDCPCLVILDSCYSGELVENMGSSERTADILQAIGDLFSGADDGNDGHYLMASSRSDELSFEDDRHGFGHGLFSVSLLEALGYCFWDDGIEGTGLPDSPKVTVSAIWEKLAESGIQTNQNPQLNSYFVDLVLFTLPDTSRF